MKTLLTATALAFVLTSAALAQDAPQPAPTPAADPATPTPPAADTPADPGMAVDPAAQAGGDGTAPSGQSTPRPNPLSWVCITMTDGSNIWAVSQLNPDGSTSFYPQSDYSSGSAQPMPCDPEVTEPATPTGFVPGPSFGPTEDPYDGDNTETLPVPPPVAGPVPAVPGITGIRRLIQGPGRTIILINPDGSIIVRGLPGSNVIGVGGGI